MTGGEKMRDLLVRILSVLGSIASVWAFVIFFKFPYSEWIGVPIAAALVGVYLFMEIRGHLLTKDFRCKAQDVKAINKEMVKIVGHPGKTTILSRDLSWASSAGIAELLKKKARAGELALHIHHATDLSAELAQDGAAVTYYEATGFIPQSRYTMLNTGQPHATIAIGFREGEHWIIRRHRNGHDASFHLASDLLNVIDIAVARSTT
jgi:hypothetical protein